MRPTVSEQLAGLGHVLAEVVAPQVTDAYAADVLAGVVTTLDLLADGWTRVPRFLAWDIEATRHVLELVGVDAPSSGDDPYDIAGLDTHDRHLRELLAQAMPLVLENPAAREAAVRLFRDRADRYPVAARPRGGPGAHPTG